MGLRVTASKTAQLFACQYAFRDDVDCPEGESTEASERGTRIHEAIERDSLEGLSEKEAGCVRAANAWLQDQVNSDYRIHRYEGAYAWFDDTSIMNDLGTGRVAYSSWPAGALVCGTADVELVEAPSHPEFKRMVADWKSSLQSALHAREQLLTLALLTGASEMVAIELCEDGSYREHHREKLYQWDLDEHAERLKAAIARIQTAEAVAGDHCSACFCPLIGKCPAYEAVGEQASSDIVPVGTLVRRNINAPIESELDAAETITFLDMLEEWAEAKKKEAQAWVRKNGPVSLPNGYEWREGPGSSSGIRGKEAYALAEKYGAPPEELARLIYKTTYTKFQRYKRKGAA